MGQVVKVILKALRQPPYDSFPQHAASYHSLGLGINFTEGGKPENPKKNPRSTGETNYNNPTHMSSKFFENQYETIPRWSSIQLYSRPTCELNLEFSGERQRAITTSVKVKYYSLTYMIPILYT